MFFKWVGGRCGCVYGTKGAVDRKSLGTAGVHHILIASRIVLLTTVQSKAWFSGLVYATDFFPLTNTYPVV
jgi:hypothetical protein